MNGFERPAGPGACVALFGRLLAREIAAREPAGTRGPLRAYYPGLVLEDGRPGPLWLAGYAERLRPVLEILRPGRALRVLDAGCGYGTESFLFALLGHDVTGIELVAERRELAASRRPYYEAAAGRPLGLRFVNAHILRFLPAAGPFDVIWAMESLSHIHPAEEFLVEARRALAPGGALVVSDPNPLNPWAWLRSVRIRGSIRHRTHRRFADPETGLPVEYGQERLFAPPALRARLRAAGFEVASPRYSGFMGGSFWPARVKRSAAAAAALAALMAAAKRTPGLRALGSIYTVVARRSEPA